MNPRDRRRACLSLLMSLPIVVPGLAGFPCARDARAAEAPATSFAARTKGFIRRDGLLVTWVDRKAGKLLLDYYVKRVGSHEVIMERLHLSRPTFYRRLQRGFALVAERLDELSEFAQRVPVND